MILTIRGAASSHSSVNLPGLGLGYIITEGSDMTVLMPVSMKREGPDEVRHPTLSITETRYEPL